MFFLLVQRNNMPATKTQISNPEYMISTDVIDKIAEKYRFVFHEFICD